MTLLVEKRLAPEGLAVEVEEPDFLFPGHVHAEDSAAVEFTEQYELVVMVQYSTVGLLLEYSKREMESE